MVRVFVVVLISVYSYSLLAQSYGDGSYYNDDMIHENNKAYEQISEIATEPKAVVVEETSVEATPVVVKKTSSQRKPASTFQEVKASSGSTGSFIEVGSSSSKSNQRRGSR